jgi:steroid delta-isomerase-like uncharacterized protein
MSEQKKQTIRRFWEEVFNNRNLDMIDDLVTTDYAYHGPAGQEIRGAEGLKQFLGMYFNAFPDMKVEIQDIFGEGEKIVSRVMGRGTHKGDLIGIPPTGKQVAIMVICTNRFEGGKIAEDWELFDMFGMMQQLGVIQQPAQAGS